MAVEALGLKQLVYVVLHEEWVVEGSREFDVSTVPWAEVGSQATGRACRFVVKWGHSKVLVMETLLCRLIEMIKCLVTDNLLHTEPLDLLIRVERECHSGEPVLDWVFVKHAVNHSRLILSFKLF